MKKPRKLTPPPTYTLDQRPDAFDTTDPAEIDRQWLTPWLRTISEPYAAVILCDQPVTRRMSRHLVVVRPWTTSYAARTIEEALQFCDAAELHPIGIIDGALIRPLGRPHGAQPYQDPQPATAFDSAPE